MMNATLTRKQIAYALKTMRPLARTHGQKTKVMRRIAGELGTHLSRLHRALMQTQYGKVGSKHKMCRDCSQLLPVESFYERNGRRNSYCKKCDALRSVVWQKANPAKMREKHRRQYAENPSRFRIASRAYMSRRRAQLRSTCTPDARESFRVLQGKDKVDCYWCGKSIKAADAQMDHIQPLANGGPHASFNLVPACPDCNNKKGCADPNQFTRGQQELLYGAV